MIDVNKVTAGMRVSVVERNEELKAVGVSTYMLLAVIGESAVCTPFIAGVAEKLESILTYHRNATSEWYETGMCVFLTKDCYSTLDEAKTAYKQETGVDAQ